MTDGIEAVTRTALSMALDAASLRQQAIATNIANAAVIDYVPQHVDFEARLADARRLLDPSAGIDLSTLARATPRMEPALGDDGAPMRIQLDVEAAEMARNAVHYQALIKGLARHFAILSMAVGDGRK